MFRVLLETPRKLSSAQAEADRMRELHIVRYA